MDLSKFILKGEVVEIKDAKARELLDQADLRFHSNEVEIATNRNGIETLGNAVNDTRMDLNRLDANIKVGSGSVGAVGAGKIVNIDVQFDTPFETVPKVFLSMVSTSSSVGMGNVSMVPISVTTDGFTLRCFNNDTAGRSPAYNYLAIGGR